MTSPNRTELANAIRALAMDAVQKANSGHPGAPMGMADIAEVLWRNHLRHNPKNPHWADRDRFVLSNGHASMLLYSMLHLTGVKAVNSQYERLGELSVKLETETYKTLAAREPVTYSKPNAEQIHDRRQT